MEKAIVLLVMWQNVAIASSSLYYKAEVDVDFGWTPNYLNEYGGFKYD